MRGLESRKAAGFSALELTTGITVLALVAGFAVVSMEAARPGIQANAALDQLLGQLRAARESAISQHRNCEIIFAPPDQIRLRRLNVPSGFTDLPPVSLGNAVQFMLFAGLPDTPEGFGNARAVHFGNRPTLTLLSDGRFVDSAGAPLNGTLFLGIPGRPETARAVTMRGATGQLTAYHWTGSTWEE